MCQSVSVKRAENTQVVTYGGAEVIIRPRADGRWVVYWREAGRPKNTTAPNEGTAKAKANKIARRISGNQGGRLVTVEDAHLLERLRAVSGESSPFSLLSRVEGVIQEAGSWDSVEAAVTLWKRAGHGKIERTPAAVAVKRFLDFHEAEGSSVEYRKGLKKELQTFADNHPGALLSDVGSEFLEGWISRANKDGSAPGDRYYNNRLATWKTFLNQCRKWKLLVKGEEHAAELLTAERLPDSVPPIWMPDQASKILEAVRVHLPEALNYLVIGCWLGLRPFEMHRIKWDNWDWERGYLDVGAHVARKVMQQRFVPISENARALLYGRHEDARWGTKFRRKAAFCVRSDDQVFLSKMLKEKGLIEDWPTDVMRHSYISYRIAEGHGRGQVAEWAGNSESEIRKSYRRPLRAEDGAAWFAIGRQ